MLTLLTSVLYKTNPKLGAADTLVTKTNKTNFKRLPNAYWLGLGHLLAFLKARMGVRWTGLGYWVI